MFDIFLVTYRDQQEGCHRHDGCPCPDRHPLHAACEEPPCSADGVLSDRTGAPVRSCRGPGPPIDGAGAGPGAAAPGSRAVTTRGREASLESRRAARGRPGRSDS
eukprot:767643-Hanusia_phi.AAC.3